MAYTRRKRRRYFLPRKTRLILSILALCLAITGIVVLVRGCSNRDTTQPTAPAQATVAPDAVDVPVSDPDALTQPPSADAGDDEDVALVDVPDEVVDLQSDLSADAVREVSTGTENVAVIRSAGDVIIHSPLLKTAYDKASKSYDFAPYFSMISNVLSNADYTVINIEGPLGGSKFASYRAYPQFNTPPHLLTAVKDAGADMVTLSNNHALDTYFDGLIGTIKNVNKAGLDHVGTYASQNDYNTPYIVSINNIKVGFLNYTVATNNMLARSDPAASQYGIRTTGNSSAPKDIQALKAAGAEAVVVYMHWGDEYERNVSSTLKTMAKKLADAGADVVVGGHPHVVLPCEWVPTKDAQGASRRTLVLYSMGNFLSDQRSRYRDSGIVFEFTLEKDAQGVVQVLSPHYVPVYVHRYTAGSGYDYRVVACAAMIDNPPQELPEDVLKRIKQVWNEIKALMADGPATAIRN